MADDVSWWLPDVHPDISQGDIFESVAFGVIKNPIEYLRYRSPSEATVEKKAATVWQPQDKPFLDRKAQRFWGISSIASKPGLLLSYGCQVDKPHKSAERLLFAPIHSLDTVEPRQQESILAQKQTACMPLPGVPGIGDAFADLRLITVVPRSTLSGRLASISETGKSRLLAQLILFFCGRDALDRPVT